jgi:SagB-type dehydrogenase family enzyme
MRHRHGRSVVPKIVWVTLPLALYAAFAAIAAWRNKTPSRMALNVQTSLLLLSYLLCTAGLGIFWVANQQLPVFDWHYLFGYATVLLVAVHLSFNLPLVVRFLRRPKTDKPPSRSTRRAVGLWLGVAVAVLGAFLLGMRHGKSELVVEWPAGAPTERGPVQAIEKYHEYSSHSRGGVFARAPSVDWGPAPPPFKRYPHGETIELPAPEHGGSALADALEGPHTHAPLDRARLGNILFHTSGITSERAGFQLRASPSSGALFPTEIYALVRQVADVPSGIYHYDPEHHRITSLSSELPTGGEIIEAPITFVLTSIFRRTGIKYRDRAYRYAVADMGHLLENLRIASHAAGWHAQPLRRFDESRIDRALGIDGIEESTLAVVPLGLVERSSSEARFAYPEMPKEHSAIGVTWMAHVATSLRLQETPEPESNGIALPAGTRAGKPALDVIATRRSERRFTDGHVKLEDLAGLLADAVQPPLLSDAVRIHLVVNRVEGLERGVYRYQAHELSLTQKVEASNKAQSAALAQEVIGNAAVVFVLAGDRRAMFGRDGARGYRHTFLEVGMIGERILLGAVARGLGGCPVGAFYDDDAAELIGVDPAAEWVMHFAGVGRID